MYLRSLPAEQVRSNGPSLIAVYVVWLTHARLVILSTNSLILIKSSTVVRFIFSPLEMEMVVTVVMFADCQIQHLQFEFAENIKQHLLIDTNTVYQVQILGIYPVSYIWYDCIVRARRVVSSLRPEY